MNTDGMRQQQGAKKTEFGQLTWKGPFKIF